MVRGLGRVIWFFFLFITLATPYAWGGLRHITILYSNNINGRFNPSG